MHPSVETAGMAATSSRIVASTLRQIAPVLDARDRCPAHREDSASA